MKTTLLVAALCLAMSPALAGPGKTKDHDHHAPPQVSKEFERLKALVGTWEGKTQMEGKEIDTVVTYALTSGGTALVETLGPGTPHEMVTVYANRGDKIHATHYCMLGNQPEMKLKRATADQFVFEMEGSKGITDKNEMHMRGVTLTLNGNQLKQDWVNYNKGKQGDRAVFEFTKKN